MSITEQINKIIARRRGTGVYEGKGRLQQIERMRERIQNVRSKIAALNSLLAQINYQCRQESGEYYMMLQRDPQMEERLKRVSTERISDAIGLLEKELNLLYKRFNRECVQLAFIGRARQGKSTIIKSITNLLDNDVIPAFDGTSCTGTVSIIHNYDGPFRAELEFFERNEFLKIFNDKLEKFFPGKGISVSSLEQIPVLELGEIVDSEAIDFKATYIDHYNEYCTLIGKPKMTINDQRLVAQYVAQYQLFDSRDEAPAGYEIEKVKDKKGGPDKTKALYFKYLSVKNVDIYCKFAHEDAGKLVLVDTIGIGPKDDGSIREEMYRVIEEECDGAVDIFRPDSLGQDLDDKQIEILEGIKKRFGYRQPEKWFVYVINEVCNGEGCNINNTESILKKAEQRNKAESIAFAWAKCIDTSDQDKVTNELVIPLLNLITANLDEIDDAMMTRAADRLDGVHNEYVSLCRCVAAVVSNSFKSDQSVRQMFKKLYNDLQLAPSLRKLDDEKYGLKRDEPCHEIEDCLRDTINNIYDYLPDEETIREELNKGTRTPGDLFESYCADYRDAISAKFEAVNSDVIGGLQEMVKMEMINIFFNEGLWKNIPLADVSQEVPSVEWLKALLEQVVDKQTYPQLYDALKLIVDYQVNIEGLIEYRVATSVHLIDPMYAEFHERQFVPLSHADINDQAEHIYQSIFDRAGIIQTNLGEWISEFALIPSHSFYARVHKVREKLFRTTEGKAQLEDFYFDNMVTIWRTEFAAIEQVATAFGEWNKVCGDLQQLNNKQYFTL